MLGENLQKKQIEKHMLGKYQFSYSIGTDTKEAIDIKKQYINNEINENDYKAYCLKYNLINN